MIDDLDSMEAAIQRLEIEYRHRGPSDEATAQLREVIRAMRTTHWTLTDLEGYASLLDIEGDIQRAAVAMVVLAVAAMESAAAEDGGEAAL